LCEAGIPFEIVPGVTSAIAVPAYAGIPVTHRELACSVAFITGHCAGSKPLDLNWGALAQGVDTLVFLMGVHSLPLIVNSLMEAGRSPETPIALIEQGTLPEQKSRPAACPISSKGCWYQTTSDYHCWGSGQVTFIPRVVQSKS
jgi:siroheme synthase